MRKLEQILGQMYSLHGVPERFRSVVYPETGHVYTDEMKKEMLAWFDRSL